MACRAQRHLSALDDGAQDGLGVLADVWLEAVGEPIDLQWLGLVLVLRARPSAIADGRSLLHGV